MNVRTGIRGTASFFHHFKKLLPLALCLLLLSGAILPAAAAPAPAQQPVRVGWYDSSYNTMDATGRRSGYAYEYQQKIACYTGWTYEYVSGSWPDLLQKLETGEIAEKERG